jgi:Mlc titration factor MtfA (ptsG expression regulator)
VVWAILLIQLLLSGVLGWLTWHCWRWRRGAKRATHALSNWTRYLSIHLPLFTLKTHRQRLYLIKMGQTYKAGQKLVNLASFLLSLRKKLSHGKRDW